jgi:hypothetical protein
MTEAEWQDPSRAVGQLFDHLEQAGGFTERQLRLFACACCRHPWLAQNREWQLPGRLVDALVLFEAEFGDGPPTQEQYDRLQEAGRMAGEFVRWLEPRLEGVKAYYWSKDEPETGDIYDAQLATARALARVTDIEPDGGFLGPEDAVREAARLAQEAAGSLAGIPHGLRFGQYWPPQEPEPAVVAAAETAISEARRREAVDQAALLRDVIGNPFRPVGFSPEWRTEHTVGIALKMYDERDFAAVPILADALEEAGCDDPEMLNHCHKPGIHVRGCWVVDLVLGELQRRTSRCS